MDALMVLAGMVMLALLLLGGSGAREDGRMRSRWDRTFERESRELRRTDATGMLLCRRCGASGSERAGTCPRCGAGL